MIQSLLPKVKEKSSNSANDAKNVANKFVNSVVNIVKPAIPKKTNADTNSKGKSSKEDKLKTQYENALKSRKGNATQWTLKDGTKCFFAVDVHGNILDTGSIWFTTKDGNTFKITKTQCISYNNVSTSSSDIGVSLGDPQYRKVVGFDVVKAFIEMILIPVSTVAGYMLIHTIKNLVCNLTAVFEIVKLIVVGDFAKLGEMADSVALYMVGYKLALLIAGAIIGVSSGLLIAVVVAFGTAVFMLLVDLVKVGFDFDVYMEQRELDSYEELAGYLLAQVTSDIIYNFLIANFLKFAKNAKTKIAPKAGDAISKYSNKVSNTIKNATDKAKEISANLINKGKEYGTNAINKAKDTVNNIANKIDDALNKVSNWTRASTIDDIIRDAKDTTKSNKNVVNLEKSGGYKKALKDFKSLRPLNVKVINTQYGDGFYGVLNDGTEISVRPDSKTGGPTLEIIIGKKTIKIRY